MKLFFNLLQWPFIPFAILVSVYPSGSAMGQPRFSTTILNSNGQHLSTLQSVLPSQVYRDQFPQGLNTPEVRTAQMEFMRNLLRGVSQQFPRTMVNQILSQFPNLGANASLNNNAAIDRVAEILLQRINQDVTALDNLIQIPLRNVPALHQALFIAAGEPNPIPRRNDLEAFDHTVLQGQPAVLNLSNRGCNVPRWVHEPVLEELGLYARLEPMDQSGTEAASCFQQNSVALANALNRMSNTLLGDNRSAPLTVRLRNRARQASNMQELLAALSSLGFDLEIYTTRNIADFFELTHLHRGSYRSIRLPLWMRLNVNNRELNVPAEHAEVGLLLKHRGVRYAQLRFYFGLPVQEMNSMSIYWRAEKDRRAPWSGYRTENIEVFRAPSLQNSLPWFESAATVMAAFNGFNSAYRLPANGYGVFVCVDSLTMVLSKLASLRQATERVITRGFPVMWPHEIRLPNANIALEVTFADLAGMDRDRLRDYPSDALLSQNGLLQRLRSAFPQSSLIRFNNFPETQRALREAMRD